MGPDALQVAYPRGAIEKLQGDPGLQLASTLPHTEKEIHYIDRKSETTSTILGLRKRNFGILVLLALVVVATAVGGSIGGILAVRAKSSPADGAPSTTTSMPHEASSVPPASMGLPSSTAVSSTAIATESIYVPPAASLVPYVNVTCPKDLVQSFNGKIYDCLDDSDVRDKTADITGISAYSLQQCIDACSTMNIVVKSSKCVAVSVNKWLGEEMQINSGANCWLKTSKANSFRRTGSTLAMLRV